MQYVSVLGLPCTASSLCSVKQKAGALLLPATHVWSASLVTCRARSKAWTLLGKSIVFSSAGQFISYIGLLITYAMGIRNYLELIIFYAGIITSSIEANFF